MFRCSLSRGVSAGALGLALSASIAQAQQSLPTIDVGGQRRAGPAPRAAPGPGGRPAIGPTTSAETQGGTSTVSSEPKNPTEGYVVRDASTGMKADIPIRQTPVTINVVPKQVIRDQALTSLQGALENVPGARGTNRGNNDITGYAFKIRGFDVRQTFRNQLNQGGFFGLFTDLANVERIEVLKGPASILYGRSDPGGLVNIVTKQPLFTPRYVVEQQIGNYDHYRTQWDFSAPVEQVQGLAYRVSGAYQNSRVFRQFQHGERFLIAPVVTYQPSPWTEFTADLQYLSNKVNVVNGIPTLPNASAPLDVPLRRSYQEPNVPRSGTDSFVGSYVFRQNLNEDWKIVNRFLYLSHNSMERGIIAVGFLDAVTLNRFTQFQSTQGDAFSTNINLEGKFDTFGAKHTFLFGLDYLNQYSVYAFGRAARFPINVFAPIYGLVPGWAYDSALFGGLNKGYSSNLQRQKGMYVQDLINVLDDKAHILLGVRYDIADVTSGSSASAAPNYSASAWAAAQDRLRRPSRQDKAWSPRFGVVYDVIPEASVYGSYTRSFGPNNSTTTGQTFPPQIGVQWEVGLKTQPLPDLSANLAIFQLTRSNLTTRDFASTDPTALKLAGLQRSRGIELDIMGRFNDRLAILANYALIDAKVIADNARNPLNPYGSGLYLNHLDNVPRHSGKVWLTYDFGDTGLGWRVGGGVTVSTRAWGDIQNTFLIPGWARLDAMASYAALYEGHKLTAQLNLNNITNTRYFTGTDINFNAGPRLAAFPAEPLTVIGTLKFEW